MRVTIRLWRCLGGWRQHLGGLQFTTEWTSSRPGHACNWISRRDLRTDNVKVGYWMMSDGGDGADGGTSMTCGSRRKTHSGLPFPFSDNFESGLDNWAVSGHDWGLTTTTARTVPTLPDGQSCGELPTEFLVCGDAGPPDRSEQHRGSGATSSGTRGP